MKKASQFKIQLEIHHRPFLKEVRAKVFIKFCLKNTDSNKGQLKHNKKKEDATVKNLSVSNYIANAFKDNTIVIRIANVMTVVIEMKMLRNTRRQLYMYWRGMQGDFKTKKRDKIKLIKLNLTNLLAWGYKQSKLKRVANVVKHIALKNIVSAITQDHFAGYSADARTASIIKSIKKVKRKRQNENFYNIV